MGMIFGRKTNFYGPALALLAGFISNAEGQVSYNYPDLVRRMTDLERLAVLPQAGETTDLASTYDRRSRYDAAQDKYLA